MENLLKNGDYVPDGFGGFVRLQQEEAILARALYKLTCRRGSFPFLSELGSKLREIGAEKPSGRNGAARLYARQALEGMGIHVESAQVTMVGNGQASVEFELTYAGTTATVEVTV